MFTVEQIKNASESTIRRYISAFLKSEMSSLQRDPSAFYKVFLNFESRNDMYYSMTRDPVSYEYFSFFVSDNKTNQMKTYAGSVDPVSSEDAKKFYIEYPQAKKNSKVYLKIHRHEFKELLKKYIETDMLDYTILLTGIQYWFFEDPAELHNLIKSKFSITAEYPLYGFFNPSSYRRSLGAPLLEGFSFEDYTRVVKEYFSYFREKEPLFLNKIITASNSRSSVYYAYEMKSASEFSFDIKFSRDKYLFEVKPNQHNYYGENIYYRHSSIVDYLKGQSEYEEFLIDFIKSMNFKLFEKHPEYVIRPMNINLMKFYTALTSDEKRLEFTRALYNVVMKTEHIPEDVKTLFLDIYPFTTLLFILEKETCEDIEANFKETLEYWFLNHKDLFYIYNRRYQGKYDKFKFSKHYCFGNQNESLCAKCIFMPKKNLLLDSKKYCKEFYTNVDYTKFFDEKKLEFWNIPNDIKIFN